MRTMEFLGVRGIPWIPWHSMKSMEFHEIHGIARTSCKFMDSMESHWSHGTPCGPWNSIESTIEFSTFISHVFYALVTHSDGDLGGCSRRVSGGCCGVRGGEEVQSTENVLGEVVALDQCVLTLVLLVLLVLIIHVQSVVVRAGVTRAVAVCRRQLLYM